ncbi:MAG: hypothetical protein ACJ8FY_12290 [Gemmataceae bacterium]
MQFPNQGLKVPVELDVRQVELSQGELEKLRDGLVSLDKVVFAFPAPSLHILIERFPRSTRFQVRMSLFLSGETVVAVEEDDQYHPAFERCVDNLLQNVHEYKERMSKVPERAKQEKGTRQVVEPTLDPDPAAMDAAVREGNFAAFRTATFGYEEPLRKRIGRWVERFPEVSSRIGKGIEIADIVEEVFLNAFEHYENRPMDVRFGDWLEGLIDPAIKALLSDDGAELENINMARAARAQEQGPESV